MLDIKTIEKYDKSGMYKVYDKWPQLAKQYYNFDYKSAEFDNIDHIVFAGMGGSGTVGDIFSSILSKSNIHVCVVKGYHLPQTVDENTLVVTTSISGNTIETLTVLDAATKTKCKVIAFSSGGKMSEYCKKHKTNHQDIPQIHSPRASFVSYLYGMLNVLQPVCPVKKEDIVDSIQQLEALSKQISSSNLAETNPSLGLAQWITGIPLIYYPWGLQAAAVRFKNSLQENAKLHAMAEDVVEACHNGIVSWEKKSNVKPVLIEGYDDYIKTKQVWKILKEYFTKNQIDYREVNSVSGSILSKLINLIYLLDFATIYLAIISKTDPSPIQSIDFVKNAL